MFEIICPRYLSKFLLVSGIKKIHFVLKISRLSSLSYVNYSFFNLKNKTPSLLFLIKGDIFCNFQSLYSKKVGVHNFQKSSLLGIWKFSCQNTWLVSKLAKLRLWRLHVRIWSQYTNTNKRKTLVKWNIAIKMKSKASGMWNYLTDKYNMCDITLTSIPDLS